MATPVRRDFLSTLEREFGPQHRLGTSASLFTIRDKARVYVRYSKVHERGSTFFGLRQADIALLEGFPSFIAFLWDGQKNPLLIPYEQFAAVFQSVEPASDGQYKAHIYVSEEGTDLHIVRAGRFGVDSHFGLGELRAVVMEESDELQTPIELSHHQVQTIVGAIGKLTGHAIYIPSHDRPLLDWSVADRFELANDIPSSARYEPAASMSFIDVWNILHRFILVCFGLMTFTLISNFPEQELLRRQSQRKHSYVRSTDGPSVQVVSMKSACSIVIRMSIAGISVCVQNLGLNPPIFRSFPKEPRLVWADD